MALSAREKRLSAIRRLVRENEVASHQELIELLGAEGLRCTQGTVSRDLADLGLKKDSKGVYANPDDVRLRSMMRDFVLTQALAMNLVVVKTSAGSAQAVAAALDAAELPEAVGTIAGDDTIMIVTSGVEAAEALGKRLETLGE
jgi:transcriptional regulator of arginine metabolism